MNSLSSGCSRKIKAGDQPPPLPPPPPQHSCAAAVPAAEAAASPCLDHELSARVNTLKPLPPPPLDCCAASIPSTDPFPSPFSPHPPPSLAASNPRRQSFHRRPTSCCIFHPVRIRDCLLPNLLSRDSPPTSRPTSPPSRKLSTRPNYPPDIISSANTPAEFLTSLEISCLGRSLRYLFPPPPPPPPRSSEIFRLSLHFILLHHPEITNYRPSRSALVRHSSPHPTFLFDIPQSRIFPFPTRSGRVPIFPINFGGRTSRLTGKRLTPRPPKIRIPPETASRFDCKFLVRPPNFPSPRHSRNA